MAIPSLKSACRTCRSEQRGINVVPDFFLGRTGRWFLFLYTVYKANAWRHTGSASECVFPISGDKIQQTKLPGCWNRRFIRVLFILLWNYREQRPKREIWCKNPLSKAVFSCDKQTSALHKNRRMRHRSQRSKLIAIQVCTCLTCNISQTRSARQNLSRTYFSTFDAEHYGLHGVLLLPIRRSGQAAQM